MNENRSHKNMIFDERRFFRKLDAVIERKVVLLILKYGRIPKEIWDRMDGDLFDFYFCDNGDLSPEQIIDCWNGLLFEVEEMLKEREVEKQGHKADEDSRN